MKVFKVILQIGLLLTLGILLIAPLVESQVSITASRKGGNAYIYTNYPDNETIEETSPSFLGVKDGSISTNKMATSLKTRLDKLQENHNLDEYSSNYQLPFDSSGVIITIPNDTINLATTELQCKSYQYIKGLGAKSTLKQVKVSTTHREVITVDSDSFVVIDGVNFVQTTADYASYATEHECCIYISNGAKYVWIKDCIFNYMGDAIYIGGSPAPEHIYITGCIIMADSTEAYDPPASRNGISCVNGKDIRVTGNYFYGGAGPGCIDLEPGQSSYIVDGFIAIGNYFYPSTNGMYISSGNGEVKNVIIEGNYTNLSRTANYAVNGYYLIGSNRQLTDISIKDCMIVGGQNDSNIGVQVRGGTKYCSIEGCNINHIAGHGIVVQPNTVGVTIKDNDIGYCQKSGIYVNGIESSVSITDYSFEDNSSSWIDIGSPTTNERSGDFSFAGSYSRKVVTNDANEGVGQRLINLDDDDYESVYDITAYVYINVMPSGGEVELTLGEEEFVYGKTIAVVDKQWTKLRYIGRQKNGYDTLKVSANMAAMIFYVDSVTVVERSLPLNLDIVDNAIHDNNYDIDSDTRNYGETNAGLHLLGLASGRISDNEFYNTLNDSSDLFQDMGINIPSGGVVIGGSILNNNSRNQYNTGFNLLGDICYSSFSLGNHYNNQVFATGTSHVDYYFDADSSDLPLTDGISFVEAKTLTFTYPIVPDSQTTAIDMYFEGSLGTKFYSPCNGKLLSMAVYYSETVTSGKLKIFPLYNDYLSTTITGAYRYYGWLDVGEDRQLKHIIHPNSAFRVGDLVGARLYTTNTFTPDSGSVTVTFYYE